MLEKIFGKKSTGVVYIVCASVLILSLIGAAVFFSCKLSEFFALRSFCASPRNGFFSRGDLRAYIYTKKIQVFYSAFY